MAKYPPRNCCQSGVMTLKSIKVSLDEFGKQVKDRKEIFSDDQRIVFCRIKTSLIQLKEQEEQSPGSSNITPVDLEALKKRKTEIGEAEMKLREAMADRLDTLTETEAP